MTTNQSALSPHIQQSVNNLPTKLPSTATTTAHPDEEKIPPVYPGTPAGIQPLMSTGYCIIKDFSSLLHIVIRNDLTDIDFNDIKEELVLQDYNIVLAVRIMNSRDKTPHDSTLSFPYGASTS